MSRIAVVGTLDTKGAEHQFVADLIAEKGHVPILVDVGGLSPATVNPDVPRDVVAKSTGIDIEAIVAQQDRGALVSAMSKAAAAYLVGAFNRGEIEGIISLGGSGGTAIATAAMRALPIGVPKVMVSTMASGDVQGYVGEKDVVMMPSIVDVAGLNRFSRVIFSRAVGAICGMVDCDAVKSVDRPVIVASMFGNTTDCVQAAQKTLESAGYEVLVFHSTGAGGRTMESLIESGLVAGVLDVTTTEWADELVGGVLSAGPNRLEAAARNGVPSVVAPGCLDMVNFGSPDSVPPAYKDRILYPS
ncbi:Tm-1-like ATP-binding domain-containing protein [Verrucomicrobia bacterium]|nr:Tm-1-like ATP-binding domain-containing protein [Verrucomicrobiota bacterium]